MAIIPIDPFTRTGWKYLNKTYESDLSTLTGAKLREGVEMTAWQYHEMVWWTRHEVLHYPLLAGYNNAIVQILENSQNSINFTVETSQFLVLNNYLEYYITFFDPTFALISANPDTVPRTYTYLHSNAGNVGIYLRVSTYV